MPNIQKPITQDIQRTYYSDGRLKSEISLHGGKPDGDARWFGSDGRLNASGHFSGGQYVPDWFIPRSSTREAMPWMPPLLFLALVLLPLSVLFRRRTWWMEESRSILCLLCLVQGGILLAAGLLLMDWMSGGAGRITAFFAIAAVLLLLFGMSLVGLGFYALHQGDADNENTGGTSPPSSGRARLELITSESKVISAPRLLRRYQREIVAIGVATLTLVVAGPALAWRLAGESGDASYVMFLWGTPCLGILLAWGAIHQRITERTLCRKCQGRELLLSPDGLRAAIGLFDRATRRELRLAGRESRLIPWSEIEELSLKNRGLWPSLMPRYFRVKLRLGATLDSASSENRTVYLRANYFEGREAEILGLARKYESSPRAVSDHAR